MSYLLEKLLLEKKKRENVPNLLQGSFTQQENFVNDPARRKVALCNRRASKSYSIGIDMITTGLLYPKSTMTFLSMTLSTCQRILIKDIVYPLNDLFKLNLQIMSKEIRFPNGSIIYMVGIDQGEKQKNKLLGQKQRLMAVDEAQDITIDLEDLIERVVEPALIDLNGRIIIAGTPSDNTSTYFYKITKGYQSIAGWSYHAWSSLDNPYMKDKVKLLIEEKEKENPFFKTTDYYQQMYLGKWVINKDALIYKPTPQNFNLTELPNLPEGQAYIYILGIDLGFKDADAFIVMAYSLIDKHLYIIEAHRQSGNDDVATALMIKRLAVRYSFTTMVIDGAALKSVETMRQRFQLPLKAANKLGKKDHITLFNMDLQAGIIKILPQAAVLLKEEWSKLIWDPKHPNKEKEGLANHCSDAALYGFMEAHNWASIVPDNKIISEQERFDRECDMREANQGGLLGQLQSQYDRSYNEF